MDDKMPSSYEKKKWKKLDRNALDVIPSKNVAFNVANETTTHGLMKALLTMYEKPSTSNKLSQLRCTAKWSELPDVILIQIAGELTIPDNIRLGSVCVSWSSITKHIHQIPRQQPQPPWLMLPLAVGEDRATASFYSLTEKRLYHIRLPAPNICDRMWIGSSCGWLVTADECSELHILNPITRAQHQLPSILSLPSVKPDRDPDGHLVGYLMHLSVRLDDEPLPLSFGDMRLSLFRKAVMSWTSRGWLVVLVFHPGPTIALARAGDEKWTPLHSSMVDDVLLHGEQLYYINVQDRVLAWDLSGPSPEVIMAVQMPPRYHHPTHAYLVQLEEEIMVASRISNIESDEEDHRTVAFEVCKLHTTTPRWVRLGSLGDRVLFVGNNCTMALSSRDFPELRPNCIYFTDDHHDNCVDWKDEPHRDIGVFSLEDGSVEPCCIDIPLPDWPAAIWIVPSLV